MKYDSIQISMSKALKLKGYSTKTIKTYLSHVGVLRRYYNNRNIAKLGDNQINQYILHMIDDKEYSSAYVNQAVSAIKFLYSHVFRKPLTVVSVSRPKKEKKLPDILSHEEIEKIFDVVDNLKHKAILVMVYSAGLRVGEVVRLRIRDIDSMRMLIHIRQGKGKKDRYTILSNVAIEVLRTYFKKYRPTHWLFEGAEDTKHITERSGYLREHVREPTSRRMYQYIAFGIHLLRICWKLVQT